MAKPIIAHSAHQSTDKRIKRGQQLLRSAASSSGERGAWFVPAENGIGFYEVRLSPIEFCECSDYEHCKHIHAAVLAQSKSGTCSCCGHRVLGRFLSEVTEDDELLSWFVGDLICAECVRVGYWVGDRRKGGDLMEVLRPFLEVLVTLLVVVVVLYVVGKFLRR